MITGQTQDTQDELNNTVDPLDHKNPFIEDAELTASTIKKKYKFGDKTRLFREKLKKKINKN